MHATAAIERERRAALLELVAAGARLAAAGLILSGEGNLSRRLDDGTVLVTPQGADKGRLAAADVAVVASAGGSGRPSSEQAMHLAVYRRHQQVRAVVHAHPPWVLRLAASGRAPECHHLEETQLYLGRVGWVPFHPSGSTALAEAVAAGLDGVCSAVMDRHGAVAIGPDLETALRRMLLLERLAELELAGR